MFGSLEREFLGEIFCYLGDSDCFKIVLGFRINCICKYLYGFVYMKVYKILRRIEDWILVFFVEIYYLSDIR